MPPVQRDDPDGTWKFRCLRHASQVASSAEAPGTNIGGSQEGSLRRICSLNPAPAVPCSERSKTRRMRGGSNRFSRDFSHACRSPQGPCRLAASPASGGDAGSRRTGATPRLGAGARKRATKKERVMCGKGGRTNFSQVYAREGSASRPVALLSLGTRQRVQTGPKNPPPLPGTGNGLRSRGVRCPSRGNALDLRSLCA
jgi:hypothetical protein